MARTFKDIEIEGKKAYALFDTGSLRSYITNYKLGIFLRSNCEAFFGKAFFRKVCLQICAIDGLKFDRATHPVEEIGLDERCKRIDVIIGAAKQEAAKKIHKMPCLWREREHKQFSRALAACP